MPVIVRIIALLYYVGFALGIIGFLGILILGASKFSFLGTFASLGVILMGIILILSFVCFIIGRGLYRGKNWARILQIVFNILTVVNLLFNFSAKSNLITMVALLLNIIIIAYLLFNKKVKEAFKQDTMKEINTSRGNSLIITIFIILAISIGIGYYLVRNNNSSQINSESRIEQDNQITQSNNLTTSDNLKDQNNKTEKQTTPPPSNNNPYTGWNSFKTGTTSKDFTFQYPQNWEVKESSGFYDLYFRDPQKKKMLPVIFIGKNDGSITCQDVNSLPYPLKSCFKNTGMWMTEENPETTPIFNLIKSSIK